MIFFPVFSSKNHFSPQIFQIFRKKNHFFSSFKMRFSIQEDGKPKMIFHTLADAQKETGLNWTIIKTVLNRNNSSHHRRSDNKLFFIKKESPVKILTVQGKDFFSLEEIQQEFGLSPTKFKNQIKNQNFSHKIDWISPEILSPGNSSSAASSEQSESKNQKSEIESLREEMRKEIDKVESLRKAKQDEMRKEIDFLSARVLQLEKEKELMKKKSSPEKSERSGAKPEEISSGKKIRFDTSKQFTSDTFSSAKTVAKFLRFGISGEMVLHGPKKNKTVALDGKIFYVPDLLKEIISSYLNELMFKDGDKEAKLEFVDRFVCPTGKKNTRGRPIFVGKIRTLDEEIIHEIAAEFMKYL